MSLRLLTLALCLLASPLLAADPPKPTTQSILQSAHRLVNQKKSDEAIPICEQIMAAAGATPPQKLEAFDILVDISRRKKDNERALAIAARIAAALPNFPDAQTRSDYLQAEILVDSNRKPEAIPHYAAVAKSAENPKVRQLALVRIAYIHTTENHPDEALAAYEQIFTDTATVPDAWFETQKAIVALLRKTGRHEEALKAARICLDTSSDANNIQQNTSLIANIFKDLDKNTTRANAFLQYQQFGPNGKDAAPSTADDLTNPLASIPYPAYPERKKAFANARAAPGDDAAASRFRALTCLYAGHPDAALPHLAEYFRRSHLEPYPMFAVVNDLIILGVRPIQGHAVGLERFYQFVAFGPPGPDGTAGTPDDLKDPFAEIGLPPRTPTDDGGLVPPPPTEKTALTQLRPILESMAATEHEDQQFRLSLFAALERLHNSLCDWGTKGQTDWYLGIFPDSLSNEFVAAAVLQGGEAAARGSDLHFAGQAAFWKQVDAILDAQGRKLPQQPLHLHGRLQSIRELLAKPPTVNPSLRPLK